MRGGVLGAGLALLLAVALALATSSRDPQGDAAVTRSGDLAPGSSAAATELEPVDGIWSIGIPARAEAAPVATAPPGTTGKTGTIRVEVLDESGGAVPSAPVQFISADDGAGWRSRRGMGFVTADERGVAQVDAADGAEMLIRVDPEFLAGGGSPGVWRTAQRAPREDPRARRATVSAEAPRTVRLLAPTKAIFEVRVVRAGAPVSAVRVGLVEWRALSYSPSPPSGQRGRPRPETPPPVRLPSRGMWHFSTVTTDENGLARIGPIAEGDWWMDLEDSARGDASVQRIRFVRSAGVMEIELDVPPIRGRVVRADGNPFDHAWVRLRDHRVSPQEEFEEMFGIGNPNNSVPVDLGPFATQTDEDGWFEFRAQLERARLKVVAWDLEMAPSESRAFRSVDPSSGARELQDIVLTPAGMLTLFAARDLDLDTDSVLLAPSGTSLVDALEVALIPELGERPRTVKGLAAGPWVVWQLRESGRGEQPIRRHDVEIVAGVSTSLEIRP